MHKYYMLLLIGVSGMNAMDQAEGITIYKDSSIKNNYIFYVEKNRKKTDSNDKFFVKFSQEDIKLIAKLFNDNPQVKDAFTLYLQDNSNRWTINTNLNIYEQSKTHKQSNAIILYSEPKTNLQLYSAQLKVPTFDLETLNTRYGRNPANGFEKIQN